MIVEVYFTVTATFHEGRTGKEPFLSLSYSKVRFEKHVKTWGSFVEEKDFHRTFRKDVYYEKFIYYYNILSQAPDKNTTLSEN